MLFRFQEIFIKMAESSTWSDEVEKLSPEGDDNLLSWQSPSPRYDVLETGDGNIRVVASSKTTGEEEVSSSTPDGVVDAELLAADTGEVRLNCT